MGRGSNAAGNSCHGRMFELLQGLCIPLSPLSLDGLPVLCWWNLELIWWEEAGLGVEDGDKGHEGGWVVLYRVVFWIEGVLDWVGPSVAELFPSESELVFPHWGIQWKLHFPHPRSVQWIPVFHRGGLIYIQHSSHRCLEFRPTYSWVYVSLLSHLLSWPSPTHLSHSGLHPLQTLQLWWPDSEYAKGTGDDAGLDQICTCCSYGVGLQFFTLGVTWSALKDSSVLLRLDGWYSWRDQHPSRLSGQGMKRGAS